MRFFVIVLAMGALSQSAIAQTPGCKSISESAARLACYDKSAPPAASAAAAAAKPAAPSAAAKSRDPASNVNNPKYVDTISAEDAIMNARLKNICKGC
ncbi:MAG: hypothetical protein QOI87_1131 [Bradyrhizobium sp.]|jgi:hypothetical protein|nr:hypothetical protein [Bradyrhizobium sp.]